jgi:hypothetical protein
VKGQRRRKPLTPAIEPRCYQTEHEKHTGNCATFSCSAANTSACTIAATGNDTCLARPFSNTPRNATSSTSGTVLLPPGAVGPQHAVLRVHTLKRSSGVAPNAAIWNELEAAVHRDATSRKAKRVPWQRRASGARATGLQQVQPLHTTLHWKQTHAVTSAATRTARRATAGRWEDC